MNGVLHEKPDRSVFEGDVLRIEHERGDDYDVQASGWDGQPPDTWLSEHVLARFAGKRVRVTVEVLDAEPGAAGSDRSRGASYRGSRDAKREGGI